MNLPAGQPGTPDPLVAAGPGGVAVLTPDLVAFLDGLDAHLVALARRWWAEEFRFGPLLAADVVDRMDWLTGFPQLATFPATLDAAPDNLDAFCAGPPRSDDGTIRLTSLAPLAQVLAPAACYHLYDHLAGGNFDTPQWFTVRAPCFRREEDYVPLERQWAFNMREIVCVGPPGPTSDFVDEATLMISDLARHLGLDVDWNRATDPFFRPTRHPGYLLQLVDPTKHELLFQNRLALASTNLHHDHFGRAFALTSDGKPARTACVAFGLERWAAAMMATHGSPDRWPVPPAAAGP
ncbi:MAG: hypothetical protein ACT4OS_05815 [Acidimicrobiales bacterium]